MIQLDYEMTCREKKEGLLGPTTGTRFVLAAEDGEFTVEPAAEGLWPLSYARKTNYRHGDHLSFSIAECRIGISHWLTGRIATSRALFEGRRRFVLTNAGVQAYTRPAGPL